MSAAKRISDSCDRDIKRINGNRRDLLREMGYPFSVWRWHNLSYVSVSFKIGTLSILCSSSYMMILYRVFPDVSRITDNINTTVESSIVPRKHGWILTGAIGFCKGIFNVIRRRNFSRPCLSARFRTYRCHHDASPHHRQAPPAVAVRVCKCV